MNANTIEMVTGVVSITSGTAKVLVKMQRPVFVGCSSSEVDVHKAIDNFMQKTASSQEDVLLLIEYAADLKARAKARQTALGDKGKMNDEQQKEIFARNLSNPEFLQLVATIGPKAACLKFADEADISSLGEKEAEKIVEEASIKIKKLHNLEA